jgi:hypothetical protein
LLFTVKEINFLIHSIIYGMGCSSSVFWRVVVGSELEAVGFGLLDFGHFVEQYRRVGLK